MISSRSSLDKPSHKAISEKLSKICPPIHKTFIQPIPFYKKCKTECSLESICSITNNKNKVKFVQVIRACCDGKSIHNP